MIAISLWQPWASAIPLGLKKIETRHWPVRHRGLIAIHAAKRWTAEEREFAATMADIWDCPALREPPLGSIVATARLVGCERTEALLPRISGTERAFGNYGPNRFGWLFEDVTPVPAPIPFKGAQGLFEVPDSLLSVAPAQGALL
jgi:hypothetical protein